MAWWVSAAIKAAPYVYSAISGSQSSSQQADYDSEYALANSIAINQTARNNAQSILSVAKVNNAAQMASVEATNTRLRIIDERNIEQTIFLSEYNAQLDEQEALLVFEQANVDMKQLRREHGRQLGGIRASHGASGAMMDSGTTRLVVEDTERQQKYEEFIVQRGADVKFKKLLDSAALSRSTGYMEAGRIEIEGKLLESNNVLNARLGTIQTSAQSVIDATAVRNNGAVQSSQVLQQGMLSSDKNNYAASSSFWSGMFNTGASLLSSYLES